eukprot:gene7111-9704_t
MSSLPEINVLVLSNENGLSTSLSNFCHGKAGVIDFWHTKCVRCPAALEKMNQNAASLENGDTMFIACALSQGEGNEEDVKDLSADWDGLIHLFMDLTGKEQAKTSFGFNSVPFCVVFDQNGLIVASGDPKSFDYISILKNLTVSNDEQENVKVNSEITNISSKQENVFTLTEDF